MKSWQEAMLFNTTAIVANGGSNVWTGTGFFIQANGKLLLVSNRHVLEDDKTIDYSITIHKQSSSATGVVLEFGASPFHIDYKNPFKIHFKTSSGYVAHPNSNVDLALIDLTGIANPTGAVLVPFSPKMILDWNRSLLAPTQTVMFVGYPDMYSDAMHHLPVVRTGSIASLPMLNFNGEPTFLIDAQLWPGSSGSPVYISAEKDGGTFSVIGVIRSTVTTRGPDPKLLGLGHAIKSSELLTLIEAATGPVT